MITRRWVLNGLIAAPAVIIAGRFMPPPVRSVIYPDFTLIWQTALDAQRMIDEMMLGFNTDLATGEMLDRWESDQSLRSRLIGHIG